MPQRPLRHADICFRLTLVNRPPTDGQSFANYARSLHRHPDPHFVAYFAETPHHWGLNPLGVYMFTSPRSDGGSYYTFISLRNKVIARYRSFNGLSECKDALVEEFQEVIRARI